MDRLIQKLNELKMLDTPGTLLYIGARPGGVAYLPEFMEAGYEITILEIWPDNVDFCRQHLGVKRVVGGDVRAVDKLLPPRHFRGAVDKEWPIYHFDVAFWHHGPEHVEKCELASTLEKLEALADCVILGCPCGKSSQGIIYNNIYEQHIAALEPADFKSLGYEVDTWEDRLIAWKGGRHGG